jgi:adenylate kinase family enzyme
VRRINVIGTSCAGKSTFAARLAERLRLPHVELDALHWKPGWQAREPEEFRAHVATAVAEDGWVIDGNYAVAQDVLWPRVDTVIWLDYELGLVLGRALRRTARRLLRGEPCCNGNRETLRIIFGRDSIVLWVLQTHARRRREFRRELPALVAGGVRVIRFGDPKAAEAWLAAVAKDPPHPSPLPRSTEGEGMMRSVTPA